MKVEYLNHQLSPTTILFHYLLPPDLFLHFSLSAAVRRTAREMSQIKPHLCAQQGSAFHETESENWFPSWVKIPAWSAPCSPGLYRVLCILLTLFQQHWFPCDISTHQPYYSYFC